jgi:hypothetical protein
MADATPVTSKRTPKAKAGPDVSEFENKGNKKIAPAKPIPQSERTLDDGETVRKDN